MKTDRKGTQLRFLFKEKHNEAFVLRVTSEGIWMNVFYGGGAMWRLAVGEIMQPECIDTAKNEA